MPKERILIADDEPDVLALCVRIIRSEGYDVTGVSNGLEAIEIAKKEHFDLFLTDIMMPGIKGLETTQVIREFQPDLICVVMTGFGTMDTAIQALKLGFSEFVVKPFRPDDLKLSINRALEKERLRRENERLKALVPLFELNKTLMATVKEDELARKVLQTACDELNADLGILILRTKDQQLRIRSGVGFDPDQISSSTADRIIRVTYDLLETREQILVQTPEHADAQIREIMRQLNIESLLFNPLLAMDAPVGALALAKSGTGAQFATGDSELLSVLSGQAAVALQNANLFEQIQRAFQELKELDHMKSEFINIAAHELRTPLAILLGHADLLRDDVADPKVKERLQIIVRNGLRLRQLIQALLDMQTLQTGEARVTFSTLDIEELIADALQDFRLMAREKTIQISANVPIDLMPVQTDREKILSVLGNLIENAIKFTPEGGQVGIDASEHDGELRVSVWDTGIGIPEQELEKVFLAFYQVEDSLTRQHGGMGVGLWIAKGMIEKCGGRIWCESTVDQGSRFTFTLPRS